MIPLRVMGDIDAFVRHQQAAGRSRETQRVRRVYRRCLESWAAPRELVTLTTSDLLDFLADRPACAPATRRQVVNTLRSFYRWMVESGLRSDDPSALLPPVRVPRAMRRPTPDAVFQAALVGASTRDRLMLLLGAYAGLRRMEIAQVHTDDVGEGLLRVKGKNQTVRYVPLHPQLAAELARVKPGYVFPSPRGGHIQPGTVGERLHELLGPGWSAHSCRRRFATRAYSAQRDLLAVQTLLGHASVATTQLYVTVPADALLAGVLAAS